MEARETSILEFIRRAPQLTIPIYQRLYSWEKPECEQLWDDIMDAGRGEDTDEHFIGSVVCVESNLSNITQRSPHLVIDGQQRLTTVLLILEVLARRLEGKGEPIEGFSSKKIKNRYIIDDDEEGERKYKLLLTQTDKDTLIALWDRCPEPSDFSLRVRENFKFFEKKIASLEDLTPLCMGLAKLIVVGVSLERGRDNPQRIFESMNSKGKPLSESDLIRNFVLMGLPIGQQTDLYKRYWRPMEIEFGQNAYGKNFDKFMLRYLSLMLETEKIPKKNNIYKEFKNLATMRKEGIEPLVQEINKFARYYYAMALGKEPDQKLALGFSNIRKLETESAYPLFLKLYDDYENKLLSCDDFVECIRLIGNYVLRRAVCELDKKALVQTFVRFARDLGEENHLEFIKANFLMLSQYSSQRFPTDEEFKGKLINSYLYKNKVRRYVLNNLENSRRNRNLSSKETIQPDDPKINIEHIMPQNLSGRWREDLGTDCETVYKTWLHTLGNLTLTGYNLEYSNKPFLEKRDMKGGFKESPMSLNEELKELEVWGEAEIRSRAEQLAKEAIAIWDRPELPRDVLNTYYPEHADDHEHLAKSGITRHLFDIFSEQIKNLSPDITEEVLEWHAAYKLDYKTGTNFVNVAPQAKKLKLTLDMDFHELNDPEGMANDFSNRNYWMPGNVELDVKSEGEIPYAIGLVRQALEKHIGEHSNDGK